jgi:hypothetical protein
MWVTCAATCVLRFYLVGAAWTWLAPDSLAARPGRGARALFHAALALLIGVPVSLFVSLFLSELGVASLPWELAATAILIAAGLIAGLAASPVRLRQTLALSGPGALVVFLGIAVILNLPRCGEWVVGGWDPGVYINEGVCVGRTGTFHPAAQPHHAALTDQELPLFSRDKTRFREIFPGIPLDSADRRVNYSFFRLTPTLVSALTRCGGLCAATRVNLVMGFLGLVVLGAFLLAHRFTRAGLVIAPLLLVTHPLWLYHLHFPTSEMTELFLLLGLGTLLPAQRTGWFCRIMVLVLLLAAIVNRVSFVPFSGMIVLATAWADMNRPDRGRVIRERLLQILTIGLGTAYAYTATAVMMAGLHDVAWKLMLVAGLCLALALSLDLLATRGPVARALRPSPVFRSAAAALCLLGVGAALFWRHLPVLASIRQNALNLGPFLGVAGVVLAVPGLMVLWGRQAARSRYLAALGLVLAAITALLLVDTFAYPFYPWATRRYLAFTVPLQVIGASLALSWLWDVTSGARRLRRVLAVALLGTTLALSARVSWHAISRTDYDGVSTQLTELQKHIGPRDLVVADHFKWGTPLTFIYGKQVLDGSKLYGSNGSTIQPEAIKALARLKGAGWRILWLSSTTQALEIYPEPIPGAVLSWESVPFTVREIVHSRRARDFESREKTVVFRLYAWP